MPLTRRLPKRGFTNAPFKTTYEIVNLKTLQEKFDNGATVDAQALYEKGLVRGGRPLVKVLGDGTLEKKLTVHAHKFSKAAADSILQAGGAVHVTEKEAAPTKESKKAAAEKPVKKEAAPKKEPVAKEEDVKESEDVQTEN